MAAAIVISQAVVVGENRIYTIIIIYNAMCTTVGMELVRVP